MASNSIIFLSHHLFRQISCRAYKLHDESRPNVRHDGFFAILHFECENFELLITPMAFRYTDAFVTLASADTETLVQFYSQLLNQEPKPYIPTVYAEFQLFGLRLGIFKPKPSHLQEFENSALSGMSLCLEVDDLDGAIAHLTGMGYPPSGEIATASHGKEIYAYDPAGNRLILHQSC